MSTKKRLLLTKAEMAELLEVTPRTIDNWVRRGKLPRPRFDQPQRWLVATIKNWLEDDGPNLDEYFAGYTKESNGKVRKF